MLVEVYNGLWLTGLQVGPGSVFPIGRTMADSIVLHPGPIGPGCISLRISYYNTREDHCGKTITIRDGVRFMMAFQHKGLWSGTEKAATETEEYQASCFHGSVSWERGAWLASAFVASSSLTLRCLRLKTD